MATQTLTRRTLAATPKAASQTVSAGKAPGGAIKEVSFEAGMTVEAALRVAGVKSFRGHTLQRNGKTARATAKVRPGDTVLAVAQVTGGSSEHAA